MRLTLTDALVIGACWLLAVPYFLPGVWAWSLSLALALVLAAIVVRHRARKRLDASQHFGWHRRAK